jgi:PKD domain
MTRNLDFSKNILLAAVVATLSILSLTMMSQEVFAVSDKFGIDELYPTADGGPVWFLNNEQPEEDDDFLLTSANGIQLHDEGSDVFALDAETGTQEHGVRIHADSPDGEWKNVEMTGYFKLQAGNDQFTLIGRQGPTYNDDGGCGAYGYYGLLSANGDAYFKKKLWHHGGYTDRTAVEGNVVNNLDDRWVGIKLVVYDLDDGDVKLELWVDDGDETNNWKKVTEYVDDGQWKVAGSDCDRDSDDIIDDGSRGGFRVDDSEFEFKKLSIREIAEGAEATAAADEEDEGGLSDEGGSTRAAAAEEEEDEGGLSDEGGSTRAAAAEREQPTDPLTVEVNTNGAEGVAPATFEFEADIAGGTEPYIISWNFGDDSERSDEQTVSHTFNEAGTYSVVLSITDSQGQTASDSVEITVEEEAPAEGEEQAVEEEGE